MKKNLVTPEVREARKVAVKLAKMNNAMIKEDKNLRGLLRYTPFSDLNRGVIIQSGDDVKIVTKAQFFKNQREAGIEVRPNDYNDAILRLTKGIEANADRLTVEGEKEFWKQTNIDRLVGMFKGTVDADNPIFVSADEEKYLRDKLSSLTYEQLGDLITQTYDFSKEQQEEVIDANGNKYKHKTRGAEKALSYPPQYRDYISDYIRNME